jgi:hypothetical protein
MPWDLDADVQVSEADMYFLAAYYNMTTYYYRYKNIPNGRTFLLEINPHFEHRGQDDMQNYIDARWIDTESGLFIDITAARYYLNHPQGEGVLYDKHKHEYRVSFRLVGLGSVNGYSNATLGHFSLSLIRHDI